MRLVQTSTRGENSMDVESLSLLESGSTMPHRGIALPLLTWYLCIYCCCAAAFSIYQRWMTHHSILVQPQHLIFLSINFSLLTYDHRTWWSLWLIVVCVPAHHQSRRINFAWTRLLLSVLFCVLICFGPLGIFIHRRFLTGPPIIVSWFGICWGRPRGGVSNETKEVMRRSGNKLENDKWINFPYLECSSSLLLVVFITGRAAGARGIFVSYWRAALLSRRLLRTFSQPKSQRRSSCSCNLRCRRRLFRRWRLKYFRSDIMARGWDGACRWRRRRAGGRKSLRSKFGGTEKWRRHEGVGWVGVGLGWGWVGFGRLLVACRVLSFAMNEWEEI